MLNTDKAENKPSWLAQLDKQIQGARGSTKRQLQMLREGQLAKHNAKVSAVVDPLSADVNELRDIANRLAEIGTHFMDTKVGNAISRLAFDVENVGSSIRAGKGL